MNWIRRLCLGGIGIGVIFGLFILFLILAQTGFLPVTAGEFEERALQVTNCAGTTKGHLTVGVAETFGQRYVGLSRTESLGPNEGLLFPYDEAGSHRIEMRNMDFGLDVIFVDAEGQITTIETLEAPDSPLEYYLLYESTYADGKFIIETPAGWSNRHDISTRDCVTGLS